MNFELRDLPLIRQLSRRAAEFAVAAQLAVTVPDQRQDDEAWVNHDVDRGTQTELPIYFKAPNLRGVLDPHDNNYNKPPRSKQPPIDFKQPWDHKVKRTK